MSCGSFHLIILEVGIVGMVDMDQRMTKNVKKKATSMPQEEGNMAHLEDEEVEVQDREAEV
jgi:hypothetical protein